MLTPVILIAGSTEHASVWCMRVFVCACVCVRECVRFLLWYARERALNRTRMRLSSWKSDGLGSRVHGLGFQGLGFRV